MSVSKVLWPGTTVMGAGVIAETGKRIESLGKKHAFFLIDPGILSLADPVLASLKESDIAVTVFDKVIGNPDVEHTNAAGHAYRESGADVIIAMGGGSAMDMGKGVRMLAGHAPDISIADFLSTNKNRRPSPPLSALPPMVAIPTTSGTGSEVTPWGVVTDKAINQKAGIGQNLIPEVAILDPELTVGLPPLLTAATGMDAFSHLIEAYVSTNAQPMLDPLILRGMDLIGRYIQTAVEQPDNIEARTAMLEASMLGGVALSSNWLGAAHSLAHQLSTFADMHHGQACAMMLPPQIRWSEPHAKARYASAAAALVDESVSSDALPDAVLALNETIGLPTKLSVCGVTQEMIPIMADHAMVDLNWWTNPIQPTEASQMAAMYQEVF